MAISLNIHKNPEFRELVIILILFALIVLGVENC